MKRKDLLNKNVIKAMSIGLAAAMTVMNPIATLADTAEPSSEPSGDPAPQQVDESTFVDVSGGVADAAQTQADSVNTAVTSEDTVHIAAADDGITASTQESIPDPVPGTAIKGAEAEISDVVNLIGKDAQTPEPSTTPGPTTTPGPATTPSPVNSTSAGIDGALEQAVVDAAKELAEDTSLKGGVLKDAEGNEVKDNDGNVIPVNGAEQDLAAVKKDLVVVENYNNLANEQADDVVENLVAADQVANNAVSEANTAAQTAADLASKIRTSNSIPDAQQAYADLGQLAQDLKTDLDLKQTAFTELSGKYNSAMSLLDEYQSKYEAGLTQAGSDITALKKDLDTAKANVDDLAQAVADAQADIDAKNAAALAILKCYDDVQNNKVDWTKQRNLMISVLKNYDLIPDRDDTKKIDVSRKVGFDKQDYNYYVVTYTNTEGSKVTKYFNMDRVDKVASPEDRYNKDNLGTDKAIAIYEKSQEEVDANAYVKKYLSDHNITLPGQPTEKDVHDYDVFTFKKDGKITYYVRAEIEEMKASGEIVEVNGKLYLKNPNGTQTPVDQKKVEEVAAPTALGDVTTGTTYT
ncbi:MAG: hypothetical protein K6A38_06185, partial [Lachnospiraceae bacterium]|nr:hypothetical protein [Lachnospiraceae bacterium]